MPVKLEAAPKTSRFVRADLRHTVSAAAAAPGLGRPAWWAQWPVMSVELASASPEDPVNKSLAAWQAGPRASSKQEPGEGHRGQQGSSGRPP